MAACCARGEEGGGAAIPPDAAHITTGATHAMSKASEMPRTETRPSMLPMAKCSTVGKMRMVRVCILSGDTMVRKGADGFCRS